MFFYNNLFLNIYFLIILALGYNSFKKLRGGSDFFIANKEAGVFQVTGSLLASILGSSAILGNVASSYSIGWAGIWLLFCAAFGLFLLLPLVKIFEKFKGYTLPELLGSFYGKEVKILSSLIIAIAWIGIVAAQIMGAAQIMSVISSFTYFQNVLISGALIIVYTILGGQLSIIKTDCFQLIFILVGVFSCFFFLPDFETSYNPPKLINQSFGYLDLIVLILTYSTTFLVGPDIYSRVFCAKNSIVAKKSIIYTILVLLPLSFILTKIGIFAAGTYPNLSLGTSPLLHVAANTLPKSINLLLYFGLLSAIISSADTCLLTSSTVIAGIFIKNLNSKKSINYTRIFIAILGIFSILVALKFKFILTSLLLALAVYSGAIIIPCLAGMMGYYNFKKNYVILAILSGGIIAFLGKVFGGNNANYILILAFIVNGGILFFSPDKKRIK